MTIDFDDELNELIEVRVKELLHREKVEESEVICYKEGFKHAMRNLLGGLKL